MAHTGAGAITVALVNNMPDGAFLDTEQQFQRVLAGAAARHELNFRNYTLPGLERSDLVKAEIAQRYQPLSALYDTRPDALIITGTEPVELELADEPYWQPLCELLAWAADTVPTTLQSCLTAHASLQLFNGIIRTPLPVKAHGVLTGTVDRSVGQIVADLPATLSVPHSRLNEVPPEAVRDAGYRIAVGGCDEPWTLAIGRQGRSLFVLCQGHLEYYTDSLLREYRREVRRFLFDREHRVYPELPLDYIRADDTARLERLRAEFIADSETDPLELYRRFPLQDIRANLRNRWSRPAVKIFGNWIELALAEKLNAL